jgi:hypothetical protein
VLELGSGDEFEIQRNDVAQIVQDVTRTESKKMVDSYTTSILNFAAHANFLERKPHHREGIYRVMRTAKFGDLSADSGTAVHLLKATEASGGSDIVDRISLLVYDIIHRPAERDRLTADLGQAMIAWARNPNDGDMTETERQMIVNELNHAIETKDMKAFGMVAENLGLIRGEKRRQKKLGEF